MELCDINLETWIERKWTEETKTKLPYLTADIPTRMRIDIIWHVMEDVTKGVGFIHSKKEVHRDLKPRNSNNPTPA
jgi:serine/threonine protein kinase